MNNGSEKQKTILVTGSTDGVGKITAEKLSYQGHHVLLHGRSSEKLSQTVTAILERTGNAVECYCADLSSLNEVRKMAAEISARHDKLDALINNAGVGPGPSGASRQLSGDGYELRFHVNYLAPALLSRLLLPLVRTARGRIIHVASAAQEAIDFDDLMFEHNYTGMRAYARSKLATLIDAITLSEQEETAGSGVTVNALDPGSMLNTKMVREAMGAGYGRAEDGADAQIFLALDNAVREVTGKYFLQMEQTSPHIQTKDESARSKLWAATFPLIGI